MRNRNIILVAMLLLAGVLGMSFFDRLFGKKKDGSASKEQAAFTMPVDDVFTMKPGKQCLGGHGASSSFRTVSGCEVADLTGIHEGYSVKATNGYHVITINVSAEKIADVFLRLAELPREPVFLTIEVGTHKDEEAALRKTDSDPFHNDVYYIDGLSLSAARELVKKYSTILVQDGGVKFGIGSHGKNNHDEVFVSGYKIFYVYAVDPEKYRTALASLGFQEEPQIRTVWDTFTQQTPGKRKVLTDSETTIWGMIEDLKKQGLYLAERRED